MTSIHTLFMNKKSKHKKGSASNLTLSEISEKKSKHPKASLMILILVKQFIENLKTLNQRRKFFRLSKYQLDLINDSTHYNTDGLMDNYNKTLLLKKVFKSKKIVINLYNNLKFSFLYIKDGFKKILHNLHIFFPEENLRIIWDFNLLFFLLLNIFYVPLTIGFELETYDENSLFLPNNLFYFIFNIFPVTIFLIDILVNLNTAYYSKGEYVINRKKIVKNYIMNFLFFDSLTILPSIIKFFFFNDYSVIEIFFLFRLIKLRKLILKMDAYLRLETKPQGVFNLCKLLFLIIFIAHICGCCWNYLALIERKFNILENWHFR